jgi:hypothetical protein
MTAETPQLTAESNPTPERVAQLWMNDSSMLRDTTIHSKHVYFSCNAAGEVINTSP